MSALLFLVAVLVFIWFWQTRRKVAAAPVLSVPFDLAGPEYAGFWMRLGALLIDLAVMVPLIVLYTWLTSFSRWHALASYTLMGAVSVGYYVYCHGRFGRTLGKLATGVRVARPDGAKIGWRQAWLRSSVDIAFGVLGVAAFALALGAIPDEQFLGLRWQDRFKNIQSFKPAWLGWTEAAAQIWFWSEVVTMLFNRRRRALHDFIAGTVVVVERTEAAGKQ